jgi:arylsulfatase A-like enzyme
VTFRNHHAVYLSSTHVNGSAIETGCYPNHNGIIANYDYRPAIESKKFVSTEQAAVIKKGDALSGGKYLTKPTIAEMVRAAGGRTAVASGKTVGFLLDRQIDPGAAGHAVTLSAGEVRPREELLSIIAAAGLYPGFPMYRHGQRDAWTTRALIDSLWEKDVPMFSVLWLGEPDLTEHDTAPGAPAVLAALKASDDNLGALLAALDRKGVRPATTVLVVSDHGFSTIERAIDVRKVLVDAGMNAFVDFKDVSLKRGDVLVVGNGGSVLFYVVKRDPAATKRLVELLQQSDFAGVILTREALSGTFTLDKAQIDSVQGPDVVISFRWTDAKNEFGVPGMVQADWNRGPNKGTHATLGRFDMHNTLIAAGPDFRRGQVSEMPSGNVDIAPTVLHVLGIKPPVPMDGRVLAEAMMNEQPPPRPETETLEAKTPVKGGTWQQYLQISKVGSTVYLDEGNGAFVPDVR